MLLPSISIISAALLFLGHPCAGMPEPKLPLLGSILTPPTTTGSGGGNLLESVITIIGNLGNAPPPTLLYTPHPSPECAAINGGNGGQLQCCRATVAGDQPLVVFLAGIYGYKLNPNDVNGLVCDNNLQTCPGVKVCCQVTALSPLVSLYCADYDPLLRN